MIERLVVAQPICNVVAKLQNAGYETYVVGGAIRDLLLGRVPKDYDISTSATPEQVRAVFGRRSARIIGKRFKLVHLMMGKEILEISTFRQAPDNQLPEHLLSKRRFLPSNMILDDNQFGTSEEDAWRRDFTVNALFLDPIAGKLIDYTGRGVDDIVNGVVRAIGDPKLRFEEDPVRILRALKLVGQYGFLPEPGTEQAIHESLPLIQHVVQSRLTLELEKILKSTYCHRILKAFQRYGFLRFFLPFFADNWDTPEMQYALQLLIERNIRIERGCYRNSISIAIASLMLPFVERQQGGRRGELWQSGSLSMGEIQDLIQLAFAPHGMIKRLVFSACRILFTQPIMRHCEKQNVIMQSRGYSHAREFLMIQNDIVWHQDKLEEVWHCVKAPPVRGSRNTASGARLRKECTPDKNIENNRPRRRRRQRKQAPAAAESS